MVTIQPLRRMVLVRMVPSPSLSSVLYTPSRQEVASRAVVVARGPECRFLKPDDTILLSTFMGTEMDGDQRLINESDVLATL